VHGGGFRLEVVLLWAHVRYALQPGRPLLHRTAAGGPGGGQLVAQGTPEQVSLAQESSTGRFLRPLLGEADAGRGSGEPGNRRRAA
jgi:hypothetical protein